MWEIFQSGGPVVYPMLLCSLLMLTVIIERLIFWAQIDLRRNKPLMDEVLEISRTGNWELIRQKVMGCQDFVIRVLVSGILHREFSLGKAMEAAAVVELKRMRKYLAVLDTMITVAPLLGIFGTVTGIISSFDVIGASGIEHPRAVTAGIAEALINTAAGLGIAIFSVIFYNYFTSRVEKAAHDMEKYATSLEIVFEKLNQQENRGT